jgi:hypothetical protein
MLRVRLALHALCLVKDSYEVEEHGLGRMKRDGGDILDPIFRLLNTGKPAVYCVHEEAYIQ